jgi:hypothetical protein
MRDTDETLSYLRSQHTSGSTAWRALCLKLQRVARGLPAAYPSALSAQHATPREHRVYDLGDVKQGMVAYFDDPDDSNPYGHITCVAGRTKDGELLHWTNDAAGPGRVSLVRHSFFARYWGDQFQFAATWLNGYALDLPQKRKPPLEGKGGTLNKAIDLLDKAIAHHKQQDHTRLVKALRRDRQELVETLRKFGGKRD